MTERVYRFEVAKLRRNDIGPATEARVYCNDRMVAMVRRHRKTKRSDWKVSVSTFDNFIAMAPDEYVAHHTAIAQMALHPWGD